MPDPVGVIQATLAPAFLITGTGVFLNFAQARLFRVHDRLRAMAPEEALLRPLYVRRVRLLRDAIALGVLTGAFTVATALLLLLGGLLGFARAEEAAPFAFGLAMLALFAAMVAALWDTLLSVRQVTAELGALAAVSAPAEKP